VSTAALPPRRAVAQRVAPMIAALENVLDQWTAGIARAAAAARADETRRCRPLAEIYLASLKEWSPTGGLGARVTGWLAEEAILHHALAGFPGVPAPAAVDLFRSATRVAEGDDDEAVWQRIEARRGFVATLLGASADALPFDPPIGVARVWEDRGAPEGRGYAPTELAFPVAGDDRGLGVGFPAIIVPVMEHGALVDLLALLVWPIAGAAGREGGPARRAQFELRPDHWLWRKGEARILGLAYAERAIEAGEPVQLVADPAAWLKAAVAARETCCVLEAESWDCRRIVLEAEVVCDSEALAERVHRFRTGTDRAARAKRGKILVAA